MSVKKLEKTIGDALKNAPHTLKSAARTYLVVDAQLLIKSVHVSLIPPSEKNTHFVSLLLPIDQNLKEIADGVLDALSKKLLSNSKSDHAN
jgi:hypothetical protein